MDSGSPARLKLDDLPDAPGVYLYRDRGGRVIYVGKARSLKSRVRPYVPASTARRSIQMVARQFKVATCYLEDMDGTRPRPCLLYQLNQCLGPCASLVDDQEYGQAVNDARLFLEGRNKDLVKSLKEKMRSASDDERFEAAAHYRDLVKSLETTSEKQRIASVGLEEEDYVAFHRERDIASVQVVQMRAGQVQARREFSFECIREGDAEFLAACLTRYYESIDVIPQTFCVPIG